MSMISPAGHLHEPLYYKHSGKFPISSTIFALITGLVVSAILAGLYSYLVLYMPIVYVNMLACVGFGWAIGWIVGKSLRWGRVRNTGLAVVLAIVVAAVAMYVAWAVYVFAVIQQAVNRRPDVDWDVPSLFQWISHPVDVWNFIANLYENGSWGVTADRPLTGPPLAVVWLAELGIVLYFALKAPRKFMDDPFCEQCEQWTAPVPGATGLASGDNNYLKQQIEARNWNVLDHWASMTDSCTEWLALNLHQCPECKQLHTLTLVEWKMTAAKGENQPTVKMKRIMKQFIITPAEADQVRGLAERLAAAAQPVEPVQPVADDATADDDLDGDADDESTDDTQRPAN